SSSRASVFCFVACVIQASTGRLVRSQRRLKSQKGIRPIVLPPYALCQCDLWDDVLEEVTSALVETQHLASLFPQSKRDALASPFCPEPLATQHLAPLTYAPSPP